MGLSYERALDLFRSLGVDDAEVAAKEEQRSPELVRWLFFKALWAEVIPDDHAWPGKWFNPNDPVPSAIQRMLDKGIDPRDLTVVARHMQMELLYNVCATLEDANTGIEELQQKIAENIEWRLVEYNGETGKTGRLIESLHEGFYEHDPTRRNGRPPTR